MNKMNSKQRIIMESDAINLEQLEYKIHQQALFDIDQSEYEAHIRNLFGRPVLDFAKTLVINLPGSCFANCPYCIDKDLRKNTISCDDFLKTCETVLIEKHNFNEVSITGGSLPSNKFNKLIDIIQKYCPNAKITWNTNGAKVDDSYNVSHIKYINLHRNSANDKINKELGTFETEETFNKVRKALNITECTDVRRRNHYINGRYKNIPVRLCVGDHLAQHVSGRYPAWLNVVIIHRSGVVAGSWYENDKFLYKDEKICQNK